LLVLVLVLVVVRPPLTHSRNTPWPLGRHLLMLASRPLGPDALRKRHSPGRYVRTTVS
jgi:hypothetical protein